MSVADAAGPSRMLESADIPMGSCKSAVIFTLSSDFSLYNCKNAVISRDKREITLSEAK